MEYDYKNELLGDDGSLLTKWNVNKIRLFVNQFFVDIYQDRLGGNKATNKKISCLLSLVPLLNLIIIYSVIKYFLTQKMED